jgi:mRNA deadenylase 3'-5' endonuclease subunit Ccr4
MSLHWLRYETMVQSFSISSYNILADSYANPQWYAHVDQEVLRWDKRKLALAKRIERFNTDIVCLQEVEADAFAEFELGLGAKGYTGIYVRKGGGRPDGCAMFFRQTGLRFAHSETIYYRDGLGEDQDSGHLALVCSFESDWGIIDIATTHLRWDREDKSPEEHIGYRQMKELLTDHFNLDQSAYAWIICGDLNVQSDSAVIEELISSGFVDAYLDHEQATCNPNRRAKRIDYIFHTAGLRAKPERLMEIDDYTPLPSAAEPSDHLALAATFEKR